jgi:hypothetical protein
MFPTPRCPAGYGGRNTSPSVARSAKTHVLSAKRGRGARAQTRVFSDLERCQRADLPLQLVAHRVRCGARSRHARGGESLRTEPRAGAGSSCAECRAGRGGPRMPSRKRLSPRSSRSVWRRLSSALSRSSWGARETRRVRSVRKEGRDVSSQYGREGEGGGGGGGENDACNGQRQQPDTARCDPFGFIARCNEQFSWTAAMSARTAGKRGVPFRRG